MPPKHNKSNPPSIYPSHLVPFKPQTPPPSSSIIKKPRPLSRRRPKRSDRDTKGRNVRTDKRKSRRKVNIRSRKTRKMKINKQPPPPSQALVNKTIMMSNAYTSTFIHNYNSNSKFISSTNPLHNDCVSIGVEEGPNRKSVSEKVFTSVFGFYNPNYDVDQYVIKSKEKHDYPRIPKGFNKIITDLTRGVVMDGRIIPANDIQEMSYDIIFIQYMKLKMNVHDPTRYLQMLGTDYEKKRNIIVETYMADGLSQGGGVLIEREAMKTITSELSKFHSQIDKHRREWHRQIEAKKEISWKNILNVFSKKKEIDED